MSNGLHEYSLRSTERSMCIEFIDVDHKVLRTSSAAFLVRRSQIRLIRPEAHHLHSSGFHLIRIWTWIVGLCTSGIAEWAERMDKQNAPSYVSVFLSDSVSNLSDSEDRASTSCLPSAATFTTWSAPKLSFYIWSSLFSERGIDVVQNRLEEQNHTYLKVPMEVYLLAAADRLYRKDRRRVVCIMSGTSSSYLLW